MIGWIDAQAGASGDMLLGALVDSGVPLKVLQAAVGALDLGMELVASECERGGIGATKVDVLVQDTATARHLPEIYALLEKTASPGVRAVSRKVFERIAVAESTVHRIPLNDVHFHEVGALDTLADVVGTVAGFHHLGLEQLHCSTISLGSGMTRGAHGPVPIPGPAVLEITAGLPVTAGPARMESTTPTGAALLAELVTQWGYLPAMTVRGAGYGAGTGDPQEVSNCLRLVVGEPSSRSSGTVVLEANVDDLDPRLWPYAIQRLLESGAHDAWLTPIIMKKGRPAHTLSVLCSSDVVNEVSRVIFRETTTIGLRETAVDRKHALHRSERSVLVDGHSVRIKLASAGGKVVNVNPEWRDVEAAARSLARPAKDILNEARVLAAEITDHVDDGELPLAHDHSDSHAHPHPNDHAHHPTR